MYVNVGLRSLHCHVQCGASHDCQSSFLHLGPEHSKFYKVYTDLLTVGLGELLTEQRQ